MNLIISFVACGNGHGGGLADVACNAVSELRIAGHVGGPVDAASTAVSKIRTCGAGIVLSARIIEDDNDDGSGLP